MCVHGGEVVANDVLAKVDDKRLVAFEVWTPVLSTDDKSMAEGAADTYPNTRITHFWDPKQSLGQTYAGILDLPNNAALAWDVYLVFGPEAEWGDKPPKPDYWMHQLGNDERRLDGSKLLKAVQEQLGGALYQESVLTCPECGAQAVAEMPADRCVIRHDCPACGASLAPKNGDCCVFCSYGSAACPSRQVLG